MLDKLRGLWPHLAWFLAAIIIMMDPRHVEEWAKQHELWGGIIAAVFAALLAWAQRTRPATTAPPSSTSTYNQRRTSS